jgi:hypothetical protein
MHRDSSRKGESWNTEIGNDQELTRYFLIDKSTAVRLELSFSENSKYSAAATAAILEVVQKGAALIAPSSTLINEANKKRFNDASTFVDTAISGLLGTDVKEKVTIEHAIGRDDSNTMLAQFVLLVPDSNSTVRRGRYGYQPVGMWTVVTEGITHSLFGKTQGPRGTERLVVTGLSAPSILSFRVTDSQTLVQYLDSRAAVDTAKTAYLKDRSKAGLAGALCSAVAVESGGLGLSPADVGGAVWAYARSLEPGATNPLQGACSNLDRYPA